METCPAKIPKADTNDICKTCVEVNPTKPLWKNNDCQACTANDGGLFWDGEKCAATCPENKPVFENNKICAEKCSTESYFWDPMAKECIGSCPSGRDAKDNSNICKTCREAATENSKTYYYDASKSSDNCMVSCGSDKYLENDYCKDKCESDYY